MKSIHTWLEEYGESHQNHTNKTIHWICVPLIMMSLIGLLWSIPMPESLKSAPVPVNAGTIFVALCFVYYILLSRTLALGMVFVAGSMVMGVYFLAQQTLLPLWLLCILIFAGAWVGQFIGHKIEGKKPSFFKDLQFLLIGPIWLLSFIYRKLGIPY